MEFSNDIRKGSMDYNNSKFSSTNVQSSGQIQRKYSNQEPIPNHSNNNNILKYSLNNGGYNSGNHYQATSNLGFKPDYSNVQYQKPSDHYRYDHGQIAYKGFGNSYVDGSNIKRASYRQYA